MDDPERIDKIKRKIRKLKQLEIKLRFAGMEKPDKKLVWDSFFDLHDINCGKAKYPLHILLSLTREEMKRMIDEYFALVYYELYKENGIVFIEKAYDPAILARLGLPFTAGESEIKKRFRELAKQYHPDTGGSAAQFIELMNDYKSLTGK